MRVLDLFSGLEGFSAEFKKRGHEVITVDLDPRFRPTVVADIRKLTPEYLHVRYGRFDVILASPPCQCFTTLALRNNWRRGEPKKKTREAISLVRHTVKLIWGLNPQYWVLENPRSMLRRVLGNPTATVTYCQYGEKYMKPTDLWGKLPPSFVARRCNNGDPCHERTPRGTYDKGVRGMARALYADDFRRSAIAAKIPALLSAALCNAAEHDLQYGIKVEVIGTWNPAAS